ncbi:glycosyltransferase [Dietzia lutea]|uniref:glycosyltransferase n=1 Tax=Dietzia lutea TaxID=546160 RepID=UPI001FC97F0D|nr:glycosyltransferase [Dietzia lutea]
MIGIYAHHHGSGHVQRALSVAAALDDEVTILTSARIADGAVPDPARIRIVALPLDYDEGGHGAGGASAAAVAGAGCGADPDPTAGGRLHWVPLRQAGLRRRMAMIAEWVDRHAPTVFWSDVSVEVTLGARLTGTPVISTVLPGRRDDAPHRLAHGVCTALVGGWPRAAGAPVPAGATHPLVPVGGVSRFAGRDPGAFSRPGGRRETRPRVLHLRGSGGDGHDARWDAVRDELGEVDWMSLGGPGGRWVADPWDELCRADVVISAAGQSSIADLAAADAHVVVAPEERPFDEQDATAATLARLGLAEVVGRGDSVDQLTGAVRRTLEAARSTPGAGSGLREAWEVDGAAERLAGVLEAVADGREPGVGGREPGSDWREALAGGCEQGAERRGPQAGPAESTVGAAR